MPEKVAVQFLSDLRDGKCEARTGSWLCEDALNRTACIGFAAHKPEGCKGTPWCSSIYSRVSSVPTRDIDHEDLWGEGMVKVERTGTE